MVGFLKQIVEDLSGRNNSERREYVHNRLIELGIPFSAQDFDHPSESRIATNFFVDFPGLNSDNKLLLCGHHDRVPKSPGANDNASSIAALFGVLDDLLENPPETYVRLCFFDSEEVGLTGSRVYTETYGVQDVGGVFNQELVGEGSIPVYWPSIKLSSAFKEMLSHASNGEQFFLPSGVSYSADHYSFLEQGVRDATTLTLATEDDRKTLEAVERIFDGQRKIISLAIPLLRLRSRISGSHTMRNYHKSSDSPEYINEAALKKAKGIMLSAVNSFPDYLASKFS